MSIGDANQPAGENRAQDPAALNGKILRLELDGSVPENNPFGTAVFSLGHRNPQGIAVSSDGRVLAAEHGTDVNDEINVIVAGGNYGYPCFTGAADTGPISDGCGPAADYLAPAWASGSPTLATSGATFLAGSNWADWDGDLIVSTLKEEDLRRFSLGADGRLTLEETLLDRRFGRLRAVVIGPDRRSVRLDRERPRRPDHPGHPLMGSSPRMQIRLTTTGRRTGEARTVTLYAFDAGDGALVIVGSQGGAARHPAWVHNLRAEPKATVKLGREERDVVAREVDGAERDRLWAIVTDAFPLYATYQRRTKRLIPLIVLVPA